MSEPKKRKPDLIHKFITDCEMMSGEAMKRRLRSLVKRAYRMGGQVWANGMDKEFERQFGCKP